MGLGMESMENIKALFMILSYIQFHMESATREKPA